jgi:hypothetical protein
MAGRPKYQPTDEHRHQVKVMAGFGIQQEEIARLIECDGKTLRKYYRRELDTGATEANVRVAASLYNLAVKEGNVTACIWWTKARMGWREQQDVNIGGQQDSPAVIRFEWGDALPPAANPAAPVIDGTADAKDEAEDEQAGGVVVRWQGE